MLNHEIHQGCWPPGGTRLVPLSGLVLSPPGGEVQMVSQSGSRERCSVLRAKGVLPPEQMAALPDVPASLLPPVTPVLHV